MAYRAFFALPVENFATTTGQPTNAVYGFTSMLINLLDAEQPSHVAVAFDAGRTTFRTEQYEAYKATRDKTPEPFQGQVPLIVEILDALGIPSMTKENYEADDIIATLAGQGSAAGMEVLVCSGDRDTFQLVTDDVTVLYPVKGVSTLARMTPESVAEKYGVPPERYSDIAALVGETSDNLPGVPGVGPKTAAKWVTSYGGLDAIIANAGFQHVSPIEDFDPDKWDALLAILLTSPFLLAKYGWDALKEAPDGGRFLAIASAHALSASAYKSGYVSAKHGVIGLVRTIALEGADIGITSTALCPAYVRTPMVEKQISEQATAHRMSEDEVVAKVMLSRQAVKRLIEPDEIADAITFLLTPAGRAFTGAALPMDQGWTAQ